MSLLWRTATARDPLHYAQRWADEYPLSPVAHPEVVGLIRQFPPVAFPGVSGNDTADVHERYSKIMGNVVNHHAQEWFKDDPEGFHEMTHHMTQNYLDAHNGVSEIGGLL